jgi:hypothetical protein
VLRHKTRALVRPLVLTAGGPLALLCTPYGLSIISYYHATLFNSTLKHAVTEWQPVTSSTFIAIPFFILTAGALWSFGRHARRTTVWERCALIALAVGGIDAVRNVSFFAFAALIIVGVSVDAAITARWSATVRLRPRVNQMLAAGATAVVAIAAAASIARPARHFEQTRLRQVAGVVTRAAADPAIRVFADQKVADWLLWSIPALRGRVAYDVRFELLSSSTLRKLERLFLAAGPNWKREARGYRLLVLDRNDDPLSTKAFEGESGSRILHDDGRYVVILRTSAEAGDVVGTA